jgi:type IV fimbrial biogenesis protein FimT
MNKYNCPTKQQRGITLFDLLVTLSIAAILFTTAFSGLAKLKTRSELMADKNSLLTLVKSARQTAITHNTYTTICHLEDNVCTDFASPLTAFTDHNNNKTLNFGDNVIAMTTINTNATIYWNRHNRLRFEPNGRAGGFNGTLKYCMGKRNFNLIISNVGRLRTNNTNLCS